MRYLRGFSLPAYFWLFIAYLFAPILVMAAMGFRDSAFIAFPITKWTTHWYADMVFDREMLSALLLSARVAVLSTLIALAVGLPTALLLTRTRGVMRAILVAIVVMPAFLPVVVSSIALRMFISRLGIEPGTAAIVFGHAAGSMPFVAVMALTRLDSMGHNLADAARDLGADEVIVFVRVVLPWLAPALFGAFMFCLLLSFEDFVRSFFLGGFEPTFPVLLFAKLRFGLNPGIAAISTMVLFTTMALGLYAERFTRRRRLRRDDQ